MTDSPSNLKARACLSLGVSIRYTVSGHGEISGAYWRLWPVREVVATK